VKELKLCADIQMFRRYMSSKIDSIGTTIVAAKECADFGFRVLFLMFACRHVSLAKDLISVLEFTSDHSASCTICDSRGKLRMVWLKNCLGGTKT